MKISHEVPIQLFTVSRLFNDYPYVLGHLIKLNPKYKEFYKKELNRCGFSILDNSAFELGSSIPFEELISVARELKPSHLVLPDTVHDKETTLKNSIDFYTQYKVELDELGIKPIGVVQGKSFKELLECIRVYWKHGISYIAIPFDCIKDSDYSTIRFLFFRWLGIIRDLPPLKFHFLGLQDPQEMLLYSEEEKSLITSIDSSSPILHGVVGNEFNEWGTNKTKPNLKLADNLDLTIDSKTLDIISNNINYFKKYCNE